MVKKSFQALLILISLLTPALLEGQVSWPVVPIIPKPVSIKVFNGQCTIGSNTAIFYSSSDLQFSAEFLAEAIKDLGFEAPELIYSSKVPSRKGIIWLTLDPAAAEQEGYKLNTGKNVVISAKSAQGVFYGTQSLYQLLFANKKEQGFLLPMVNIVDYPRFQWRGMHLDVSRHFFTKEFIKKYIDLLAMHKMNSFHWHLVDDQGWRIEIKKYPLLTQVGSWRVNHEDLPWNNRPVQKPGEKATYGGFYTQEDIKEVVAYASKRFINVVPEIEMPAHATCAIAAYPRLSCKQTPISVPSGGFWPITDIYCAGNDSTFKFLEDVLTEVMDLFPSKYIHVGGDEADKAEWKRCPKCQARMKAEGLKTEGELQAYFIGRIDKFLTAHRRTLIGWDEILEGGLAKNATVMSWRGIDGGIQAARMNHDVVMTPTSHCYLDYYQSADKDLEPAAFGGLLTLEQVYSYNPVPAALTPEESKHVLGAQGNMWSEFLLTNPQTEYMALPRLSALSEVDWTPEKDKNETDFKARLQNLYNVFTFKGYNYRIPPPDGILKTMLFLDSTRLNLINPLPFGAIRYTLDVTEPNENSTMYKNPLVISSDTKVSARIFLENGKNSKTKTGSFSRVKPLAALPAKTDLKKGIHYDYYLGDISTVNDIAKLPLKNTGTAKNIGIPEGVVKDAMALIYNGFLRVNETDVYTFKLISDDGSRLLLDDQLVIDSDGPHGPEPKEGQVALEKGLHSIKVLYFQGGGGQTLDLLMKSKNLPEQKVSEDILLFEETNSNK